MKPIFLIVFYHILGNPFTFPPGHPEFTSREACLAYASKLSPKVPGYRYGCMEKLP